MSADQEYLDRIGETHIVLQHVNPPSPHFVIVLPPQGAPGTCADYDADCYFMPSDDGLPRSMWEWRWARCYSGDPERGRCPFVD